MTKPCTKSCQSREFGSQEHSWQPHPSESIFFSLSFSVVISTSALWLRNNLSSPGPLELMMGLGSTWGMKEGWSPPAVRPGLALWPPTQPGVSSKPLHSWDQPGSLPTQGELGLST